MLHTDRERAESFGQDAASYDRLRPSYPDELVRELLADAPSEVLDVGCGTGIVAALLASHGCRVLGVEPDERMAAVARAKGLVVEISAFETWEPHGRSFDLLTCGQAWHWIDPQTGLQRAAAALREGGRIALFWNFASPPTELAGELRQAYDRHAPGIVRHSVVLGNTEGRLVTATAALGEIERFGVPETHSWRWSRSFANAEWVEHVFTHSDHKRLEPSRRDALARDMRRILDASGEEVEITYDTELVTARRSPGAATAAER